MFRLSATIGLILALAACASGGQEPQLRVGFSAVDITPEVGPQQRVYIAGYGLNRKATGVHDPLYARTVVLADGAERIAICCVDLVGLQHPQVKAIREKLTGFRYVLVSSTHNHEGPDVIGIWGRGPFQRGVDEEYLDLVVERVVQSVHEANEKLSPVTASFGVAEDETLLGDNRLPIVRDGVLRAMKFQRAGGNQPVGLIVQWNCHPESLGPKNKLLTADFPWATIASLERKYQCPIVYLSGAIGGLMTHPKERVFDDAGQEMPDGSFEYAQRYGEAVADLASHALENSQPLTLTPFSVSSEPIFVPVHNSLYKLARAVGVMQRKGFVWTGDAQTRGEPMTAERADEESAIESEVACLRLGDLHLACVPGELYPELVYGRFAEPAEADVDFPDASLEPTVASIFGQHKWMLVGLANDELGYIIPKRQWDKSPPYAYGRDGGQYGEVNSCGPEVAPIVMHALQQHAAAVKVTLPIANADPAKHSSNHSPAVYRIRRVGRRASRR